MAHAPIVQQDRRAVRAQSIVEQGTIEPVDGRTGVYRVWDLNGSGTIYTATPTSCHCADFVKWGRGLPCKHAQAAAVMDRELAQFCAAWDAQAEQARAAVEMPGNFLDGDFSGFDDDVLTATPGPRCPDCGAPLDTRQYYVGGKGYCFFEVCTRDSLHHASAA